MPSLGRTSPSKSHLLGAFGLALFALVLLLNVEAGQARSDTKAGHARAAARHPQAVTYIGARRSLVRSRRHHRVMRFE